MRNQDPLEQWMMWRQWDVAPDNLSQVQAEAHEALARLAEGLDNPQPRRDIAERTNLWKLGAGIPLLPEDLEWAEELYPRVVEAGGAGTGRAQDILLDAIASTEAVSSIPFWLSLLDLKRLHDKFRQQRLTYALAALARLAIRRKAPDAFDALRRLAQHEMPEIRELALYYLGWAYGYEGRMAVANQIGQAFNASGLDLASLGSLPLPELKDRLAQMLSRVEQEAEKLDAMQPFLPPDVLGELTEISRGDPAFAVRYQARLLLEEAGQAAPVDNPNGVYVFKVQYNQGARPYRIIELRSRQTLADLHHAIQQAFGWGDDHLYSFFLNGVAWDERYQVASPFEEDVPAWADETQVGALGLTTGHTFLYIFDYGDDHRFAVKLVDIHSKGTRGRYPRITESHGEAPTQYVWYDDEVEWSDEEDEE